MIARLLATALMLAPFAARGEVVSIHAEDGAALRAMVVEPAAGVARRPAVVALHGCTGLAAPD
ncbi:dienelactone hydrolase family protein, partial [Roseomonas alkaliterrae]